MKRYVFLVMGLTLLILVGLYLIFTSDTERRLEDEAREGILEFSYVDVTSILEKYYLPDTHETVIRTNDEYQVVSKLPRSPKSVLVLPETSDPEDVLVDKQPKYSGVWEVSLEESSKLLKYLESTGYQIDRKVSEPHYIEIILVNGEKKKRLVIFTDTIMVADLADGVNLLSFEDYLKKIMK